MTREEQAELEAAIEARIAGVPAARYDGDGTAGRPEGTAVELAALGGHRPGCVDDDCDCPPIKPDPISDKAVNDLYRLRAAISRGDTDTITELQAHYLPGTNPHQRSIPGLGDADPGRCITHWNAGRSIPAARGRRRCHRCDDFHAKTGHDYPPEVLEAYAYAVDLILGATPTSSKKDRTRARAAAELAAWDHPRVLRAWDATGWVGRAGVRYPQRRAA